MIKYEYTPLSGFAVQGFAGAITVRYSPHSVRVFAYDEDHNVIEEVEVVKSFGVSNKGCNQTNRFVCERFTIDGAKF